MSRKKKEEKVVKVKDGRDLAVYEPRHNGIIGETPSRRRPVVRDSWHPDTILEDVHLYGDDEPILSPEELHLA